jgi:hypothetical protein
VFFDPEVDKDHRHDETRGALNDRSINIISPPTRSSDLIIQCFNLLVLIPDANTAYPLPSTDDDTPGFLQHRCRCCITINQVTFGHDHSHVLADALRTYILGNKSGGEVILT